MAAMSASEGGSKSSSASRSPPSLLTRRGNPTGLAAASGHLALCEGTHRRKAQQKEEGRIGRDLPADFPESLGAVENPAVAQPFHHHFAEPQRPCAGGRRRD